MVPRVSGSPLAGSGQYLIGCSSKGHDHAGEEGEYGVLTLSVVDGRLALDGVIVEDERPQGFKAPERPPIGFALAPAGGSTPGSAAVH